eukprot:1159472-Pelagomonas_calceolata.AAC.8
MANSIGKQFRLMTPNSKGKPARLGQSGVEALGCGGVSAPHRGSWRLAEFRYSLFALGVVVKDHTALYSHLPTAAALPSTSLHLLAGNTKADSDRIAAPIR